MEIAIGNLIAIIGIVLNVASMLVGGYIALTRLDGRLQILTNTQTGFSERLNKVDARLETFGSAIVTIAKQEERMSAQDDRVNTIAKRFDSYVEEIKESIKDLDRKIDELSATPRPRRRKA